MHDKPMSELDGDFKPSQIVEWKERPCKCGSIEYVEQTWDSSCGGYTDYKYTCTSCKAVHWAEGPDA